MSRWLLVLVAGCNWIYDLEPTRVATADMDDDGIGDELDNCKLVANPDQADGDGDDLGDACDLCEFCKPCDRGADHDEDGDLISDGCDNCPAVANAEQANGDGDELGDACDVAGTFERRVLFDGFGTLTEDWLESGSQWTIVDDAVAPLPAAAADVTHTLEHGMVGVPSGTRWSITFAVAPPPRDRDVSLFASNLGWCTLEHNADDTWSLNATATMGPSFPATFDDAIVVRMTPAGPLGTQHVTCTIAGVAEVTDTIVEFVYPAVPKLVTTTVDARYLYIDVVAD